MVRSSKLLAKLENPNLILSERRLHWFGHVESSSGAVRTVWVIQIDGRQGGGREAQTYMEETAVIGSSGKLTLQKGAPVDQV